MALVPGKPIPTSHEANMQYFQVMNGLVAHSKHPPVMRYSKQLCGGSNRNGAQTPLRKRRCGHLPELKCRRA